MLCQGPIYLREMRRRVAHSGVRILDHSPALELLVDADGAVCGAAGVQRQKDRPWRAAAGAVILATGGCCWRSGALGSNVDTGDGYLMAAEVGATLSGMEFSNYYGIVPVGGSMDKNGFYGAATFTDADGNVLASGFTTTRGVGGARTWLLEAALARPGVRDLRPRPARGAAEHAGADAELLHRLRPPRHRPVHSSVRDRVHPRGHHPRNRRRACGGRHLLDRASRASGQPAMLCRARRSSVRRAAPVRQTPRSRSARAPGRVARPPRTRWLYAASRRSSAVSALPAGRVGLRPTGRSLPDGAWRELSQATQDEILPPAKNGFRSGGAACAVARRSRRPLGRRR